MRWKLHVLVTSSELAQPIIAIKPRQLAMQTRPGRSFENAFENGATQIFILLQVAHNLTELTSLSTSSVVTTSPVRTVQTLAPIWKQINNFWEFQYNDPCAHSHKQLNGFVYFNICFYIPNIACNMSSVCLKSPKLYHMTRAQPHSFWVILLAELTFRVFQRDQPGKLRLGADMISSSDPWWTTVDPNWTSVWPYLRDKCCYLRK